MFLEILLLLATLILIVQLFLSNRKPPGTPPGTSGLPIVGVMPPRDIPFEKFLQLKRQEYGDIFWIKMGTDNHVIICSYEDIVAAFNNPALQGRPRVFSTDLLYELGDKGPDRKFGSIHGAVLGVLNSEGERWKNLRRFIIRRLRDGGMGKSSSMEAIILREADALVEDFDKFVGKPTEIPWSVNASILNVVWELVGGIRYDIFDDEIQDLCNYLNDGLSIIQDQLFLFDMMSWLPSITPDFILNYFGKKEFEQKMTKVYAQMHKTVEEHKKNLDEDNPKDLIDSYLLDLKLNNSDSPNKSEYSQTFCERELVHAMFDLFIAGSETTSSTVKWYIFFMAKYGDIQRKVQEEIDNALPNGMVVSFDDRDKLPYFESTIHETLRLKSILPFGLFHVATEDTNIGKYFIPEGTQIIANLISCHKDPTYWEKPNEFYPEHFIKDDGTFNSKKKGLIPFSTGRRVCLGENLARMDLFLILALLMQKFTFTVPVGEVLSGDVRADQPFFTVPKPFKIIINKRQ